MMRAQPQNVQVVLYFDGNIEDSLFWICYELADKDSNFQPTIFPFNQGAVLTADMLMAVVPINEKGQVQIHQSLVSINTSNIEAASEIGKKIIKVFAKYSVTFYRVGLISNYAFSEEKINSIKSKLLNPKNAPELDFQYSRLYLKESDVLPSKINVWKRYFTASESTPNLLSEIDINTLVSNRLDIDYQTYANFLTESQKIIDGCFEEDDVL